MDQTNQRHEAALQNEIAAFVHAVAAYEPLHRLRQTYDANSPVVQITVRRLNNRRQALEQARFLADQADENAPDTLRERYDEERARRRQPQDQRIRELRQPWRRAMQNDAARPPTMTIFPRLQVVGAPPPMAYTASYNDQKHIEGQEEAGFDALQAGEAADPSQETPIPRKREGYLSDGAPSPKRCKGDLGSVEAESKDSALTEMSSPASDFATDDSEEKEEVGRRRTPPLEVDEESSSPSEFVPSSDKCSD